MDILLFDSTKLAAYYLWEYSEGGNAMKLWYCAEDIGYYLEDNGVFDVDVIENIIHSGVHDFSYVNFIRNVAYRIFVYTNNHDAVHNWEAAEKLVKNSQWRSAVVNISNAYHSIKSKEMLSGIYSDQIKKHYERKL